MISTAIAYVQNIMTGLDYKEWDEAFAKNAPQRVKLYSVVAKSARMKNQAHDNVLVTIPLEIELAFSPSMRTKDLRNDAAVEGERVLTQLIAGSNALGFGRGLQHVLFNEMDLNPATEDDSAVGVILKLNALVLVGTR